jgi:guanylate kinase
MESQDQPATKGDIQALEQRFEGRLDASEQRVLGRMAEMNRELETRMLQAFYSFAETNDRRHVQGEAATAVAVMRLSTLESRILALEKRLDLPPAS